MAITWPKAKKGKQNYEIERETRDCLLQLSKQYCRVDVNIYLLGHNWFK